MMAESFLVDTEVNSVSSDIVYLQLLFIDWEAET